MATLYELTAQYRYIYDLLSSGEIDEQTFHDSLESIEFEEEFETKAENYAKIIKSLEADAEAARQEAARLMERKRLCEANARRLKDRLYLAMKNVNKHKFNTPLFGFSIRSTPEKVVVEDISKLKDNPDVWVPRKWDESELNKTKIKELLQSGMHIEGVRLEKGETLSIR